MNWLCAVAVSKYEQEPNKSLELTPKVRDSAVVACRRSVEGLRRG